MASKAVMDRLMAELGLMDGQLHSVCVPSPAIFHCKRDADEYTAIRKNAGMPPVGVMYHVRPGEE